MRTGVWQTGSFEGKGGKAMGKALRWSYLLLRAGRKAGIRGVAHEISSRIIRRGESAYHDYAEPIHVIRDVLFVNGVPPEQAPHPYRYRVLHQMEQLRAAGYSVSEIFVDRLDENTIIDASIIVLYRCPFSAALGEHIRLAKALNRTVLFDIDDLVIDTAYTDQLPAVQALSREDRALYDEGVTRYGTTLRLCDGATTSTTALAAELKKVVPRVWINRNCASERMMQLSEAAWKKRLAMPRDPNTVTLGYFSGTLTHNADFEMIKPAVIRVMEENPQVRLLLMGKIDLPAEFAAFGERVSVKPFTDWENLPDIIAGVDINLSPVENTLFNQAKSENKWVEAALVKVATVASDIGAFAELIEDGVTGYLAAEDRWYPVLTEAVRNPDQRRRIAENAYRFCKDHCVTTGNTQHVREIYEEARSPHAAFVLPSAEMSGGIQVALRHACMLQDAGWNVDIIAHHAKSAVWDEFGHRFRCISFDDGSCRNLAYYDLMVATMWTTLDYIRQHGRVGRKAYLVQGYEKDFYPWGDPQRLDCEATYCQPEGLWHYLTVSPWCAEWLKEKYGQDAALTPNGMDRKAFIPVQRDWKGRKIRILIEGDCSVDYKNTDESFRIAMRLDPEAYEIWYMSYNAAPKDSYRCDRFLHAVPYDQVPEVYAQCDILLKSGWLEGFSLPPLEMMATGGYCVLVQNGGNSEYLRPGENALTYPLGDVEQAIQAIESIARDEALREKLRVNALATADGHDWERLKPRILAVYEAILRE